MQLKHLLLGVDGVEVDGVDGVDILGGLLQLELLLLGVDGAMLQEKATDLNYIRSKSQCCEHVTSPYGMIKS